MKKALFFFVIFIFVLSAGVSDAQEKRGNLKSDNLTVIEIDHIKITTSFYQGDGYSGRNTIVDILYYKNDRAGTLRAETMSIISKYDDCECGKEKVEIYPMKEKNTLKIIRKNDKKIYQIFIDPAKIL